VIFPYSLFDKCTVKMDRGSNLRIHNVLNLVQYYSTHIRTIYTYCQVLIAMATWDMLACMLIVMHIILGNLTKDHVLMMCLLNRLYN